MVRLGNFVLKQWSEDGLYILCSTELMLKPATTFSKMTPITQVVCIVCEARQMSRLMEIVCGRSVTLFFFGVKTVCFFIVGHHAKQCVNKIEDKECLKFVMLFGRVFGLFLQIICFFSFLKLRKKYV